tara:strand:- start:245 stop:1108 length:864 start_codon:yes stop_codon:yes gene_type:complete
MNHPAEISLHSYLRDAVDGKSTMSQEVIDQVAEDIKEALHKQFNPEEEEPRKFKLRMSNIGRPTCQLWFQKNDPDNAEPKPTSFKINMIMGDIVEAVFKGLLRASGTTFDDNDRVTLDLPKGGKVSGEYDMILDDKVDDVKSASPWSYENKFVDFNTLNAGDSFGYVSQLVGYAAAAGKDIGGWWVVNKANGNFKYVSAQEANTKEVLEDIEDTYEYIDKDEPFERCFDAVPETYFRKPSGNMKLGSGCRFCDHRFKCWPTLQALPSKVSKAKDRPIVEYVSITEAA